MDRARRETLTSCLDSCPRLGRAVLLWLLAGCSGGDASTGAVPLPAGADAGRDALVTDAAAPDAPGADGGAGPLRQRRMLVSHRLWRPASSAEDPSSHRPSSIACDRRSYGREILAGEEAFFVKTDKCNYMAARQSTIVDIRKGDRIKLRLWHFRLTAPPGARVHSALWIGDHVVLDKHLPIPRKSGLISKTWIAPQDIAAGAQVLFHIHNHGDNEYDLVELSTGSP
ncbi:MAG: hypothetical protein MJD61_12035 [Proteobacteria bacterium]|nr:hypothetical protein [Pseudomonadota bacterium]